MDVVAVGDLEVESNANGRLRPEICFHRSEFLLRKLDACAVAAHGMVGNLLDDPRLLMGAAHNFRTISTMKMCKAFLAVAGIVAVSFSTARAQTWTGSGGNNKWTTAGNWDSGVPGSGSTANFVDGGNSNTNVSLSGGNQPIGTLNFDTANAAAFNLGVLNSGDQFTFDGGGSITIGAAVTNVETINAKIDTGGDLNINLANATTTPGLKLEGSVNLNGFLNLGSTTPSSGAITVDAPITGPGIVNSTIRTGSLNLNAQSTYSGGTFFNATNSGEQPAIRLGVDSVGAPGSLVSGPLGTGLITVQSGNPAVFQPVGGDRTIANDWLFTNAIFVGSIPSAPLVDPTPHSLTLTGNVTLGTTGRVLTNNLPAGVSLNFGSSTVTSNLSLSSTLSFQTQSAVSGAGGGVTVINDPIVNGVANGAIAVQNNATLILNNANNTYSGGSSITGTGGVPGNPVNPELIVNGVKSGAGNINVNSRCGTGAGTACSATNATLIGVGVLGGTGSISGLVTNAGIISPGSVAGTPSTLTLTGNVTDSGIAVAPSHWAIDLSGASSDKLVIGGNVSLAGVDNLDVSGVGSGTSWVIATYAGTLTGTFDVVTPGYTVDYGTGSNSKITLNAAAPGGVPGDYNNNGVVDAADYVLWRNGGPLQNEVASTGVVDGADYDAWRARFGNTSGSGSSLSAGAAVPEPGTLALWMVGSGLGLVAKGRRARNGQWRFVVRKKSSEGAVIR